MKKVNRNHLRTLAIAATFAASPVALAAGFSSGSTGADGPFSPSASATITLPLNGTFNYTTVNIPAGVTIKYVRNPAGPSVPVIILATGDVTVAGTIDINGGDGLLSGSGTIGDRSAPGPGGPGGFDGGRGGLAESNRAGGNGLGPGAGGGGSCVFGTAASGAGYAIGGLNGGNTPGGVVYGSNLLTPLLGGSGGGGGCGAPAADGYTGTGGGGGGGAILIVSSGTVSFVGAGSIQARGGHGGNFDTTNVGGSQAASLGGGGSGGAIRIVAGGFSSVTTTALNVALGLGGTGSFQGQGGAQGGPGRTRVELPTTGTFSLAGVPTLTITSVAGIAAPAAPTGTGDVSIAASDPNPATVAFAASGVSPGNTVTLTLTPLRGASNTVATSAPLAGSLASSTATASINIPQGISTLTASASYTITVAMGEMLRQYAGGERVEQVELVATYGGSSKAKLITVSGKQYEVPAEVLQFAATGG